MSTLVLILICTILVLIAAGFLLVHALKEQKEINKELEEAIERQKNNINLLMKHIEEQKKIKDQTAKVTEDIQNAESEEDINSVIADIIAANNKRV